MARGLGSSRAVHKERAEAMLLKVVSAYDATVKAAKAGNCGYALRLYGLANDRVGTYDCEREAAQVRHGAAINATDREAWAAVVSCFTGEPAE